MESILPVKKLEETDSINEKIIAEAVIQEAINGSKESFLVIIDKYKAYLYKTAYLYVKNENDASEIYQNTVFKAYVGIQKLRDPKFFKTWITRILINNVYDTFRNNTRVVTMEEVSQSYDFDELVNIEGKIDLYDAIDSLNYNFKTAIILKYIHEMPIKDISEIMNCSENTVKSYLHRAKKALLRNLRGE